MEIIDSTGKPTLRTEIRLDGGHLINADLPLGAKQSSLVKSLLFDKGNRFFGHGIYGLANTLEVQVKEVLNNRNFSDISEVDQALNQVSILSEIPILAGTISRATARAIAQAKKGELFEVLGSLGTFTPMMPAPMMNLIAGGPSMGSPFLETMICPIGAPTFRESLRWGCEIFDVLRKIVEDRWKVVGSGDEGALIVPQLDPRQSLDLIVKAITSAGYQLSKDIGIALDVAADDLVGERSEYRLRNNTYYTVELFELYKDLLREYPIISIEDPFSRSDIEGWTSLGVLQRTGSIRQIVADASSASQARLLERISRDLTPSAVLIKPRPGGYHEPFSS